MIALIESGLIKNKKKSINGISRTNWHGRIQNLSKGQLAKISKNNDIWLDGAHNLHGAKALINTLIILDKRKWNVIFGYLNTRDPEDFINEISGITKKLITIEIPNQKQSISKEILKNMNCDFWILGYQVQFVKFLPQNVSKFTSIEQVIGKLAQC